MTSFAAGVALRYHTYLYTGAVYSWLRSSAPDVFAVVDAKMPDNIHISPLGEVATQGGGGVGDCGGGPLRVILGDHATAAALVLKFVALVLPLLHAMMWIARCASGIACARP